MNFTYRFWHLAQLLLLDDDGEQKRKNRNKTLNSKQLSQDGFNIRHNGPKAHVTDHVQRSRS